MNSELRIRTATSDDVSLILSFIQKNAEFDWGLDNSFGVLSVTEEKIQKNLFGAAPLAYVVFAEVAKQEVGFALYSFRYSSFIGQPSLWLDDLYVDVDWRRQGIGKQLMQHLAQIARQNDCTHLAWNTDARNGNGLKFYRQLGAKIINQPEYRRFLTWVP